MHPEWLLLIYVIAHLAFLVKESLEYEREQESKLDQAN
jgi:hypothetical protein